MVVLVIVLKIETSGRVEGKWWKSLRLAVFAVGVVLLLYPGRVLKCLAAISAGVEVRPCFCVT